MQTTNSYITSSVYHIVYRLPGYTQTASQLGITYVFFIITLRRFNCDSYFFQNDTFNVHVSLDMNNEKLGATGNLYVGTSTPTAVITELKSSLDGDYSITAPEKPMEASYRFLLDGLSLVDEWFEDGYSKPTYLRVGYVNQGTEALYDAMFLFNVNIEDETAHLAATVKWAADPE